MVQSISYDPDFDFAPAFAGMIADAMFTDKITVPCGPIAVQFGAAVFSDPATGRSVAPDAAGAVFQGIAIHDHNIAGRYLPNVANASDRYVQYDAIAVMRRGRIWARVATTITKDSAPVSVATATGLIGSAAVAAGFVAFPTAGVMARFLSANLSIVGVLPTDAPHSIALIEVAAV